MFYLTQNSKFYLLLTANTSQYSKE